MSSSQNTYLLCNNKTTLSRAVDALKNAPAILIDCEAKINGCIGGTLSLISLGVPSSLLSSRPRIPPFLPVFVVDALAFSKNELRQLYKLLEDASVRKVIFGGRNDSSELHHGQGVSLAGAIDLQIADIISRGMRGEGIEDQMQRIERYVGREELDDPERRACYTRVHRLSCLDRCVKEHGINTDLIPYGPKPSHSTAWLKRPLNHRQVVYAADDILLLDLLYRHFQTRGYILPALVSQSAKFLSIHRRRRPSEHDRYWSHGLLPLEIIDKSSNAQAHVVCAGCKRDLPSDCFPVRTSENSTTDIRVDKCFVCCGLAHISHQCHLRNPYADPEPSQNAEDHNNSDDESADDLARDFDELSFIEWEYPDWYDLYDPATDDSEYEY